ncbi:MAG: sterol desaturase family protein [Acidimicrobiales bacterium]
MTLAWPTSPPPRPPPPGPAAQPPPPAAPAERSRSLSRRILGWIHVAALIAAIATGVALGYEGAGIIAALFVLVVPFEKLFRRHRQRIRRPGLRTDLTYALVSPLNNLIGLVAGVVIAVLCFPLWLPAFTLRPLVMAQPGWLIAIEGVLLLDVLIYWTHRLSHEVPLFWRFHSIHHSSARMDWISGIRVHPFDGVLIAVPVVFALVAGFQLEVVGGFAVVQFLIGLFAHANVRWRLRPLHRIVMTPEFHHWHHGNHPESIHTNYSVFLPVWDIIFGTYFMPADRRPQRYGVDEAVPAGVVSQMLYPLRRRSTGTARPSTPAPDPGASPCAVRADS